MVFAINKKSNRSDHWANDSWGCTLKINGMEYYKDNNFNFNKSLENQNSSVSEKTIINLIEYIVNASHYPIYLYYFS